MRVISNIRVGDPDATPSLPAHTRGVKEGNTPGSMEKEPGIRPAGKGAQATARRSTGINPEDRNPIDPRMPNLSPA